MSDQTQVLVSHTDYGISLLQNIQNMIGHTVLCNLLQPSLREQAWLNNSEKSPCSSSICDFVIKIQIARKGVLYTLNNLLVSSLIMHFKTQAQLLEAPDCTAPALPPATVIPQIRAGDGKRTPHTITDCMLLFSNMNNNNPSGVYCQNLSLAHFQHSSPFLSWLSPHTLYQFLCQKPLMSIFSPLISFKVHLIPPVEKEQGKDLQAVTSL